MIYADVFILSEYHSNVEFWVWWWSAGVKRLFSIWKQSWNKQTAHTSFDTASKLVAVKFNLTAIQNAKACLNWRTVAQGWMKAQLEGFVEDTL